VIRLAIFTSTFGYCGYAPFAPGTVGSAAGLLVFAASRAIGVPALELSAIVALFGAGVWAGGVAEEYFGGIDPGPVVIDEVVGMLITLALVPVGWLGALVGFVLFRIADVIKPFPAARLERLHGGLGIMADDAMAAVYSHVALWMLLWAAPGWLGVGGS
jgi:phosphatidylglycerophosphatase A